MDTQKPQQFYVLCLPTRQPFYERLIGGAQELAYFGNVTALLSECFERPPFAVIVDVPSGVKLGNQQTQPIFSLELAWPIIRCTPRADGNGTAICLEPAHTAPLAEALKAIAANDPAWQHPRYKRRHIRIQVQARIRLRIPNDEKWRLGNCLDISSGGLYTVTYEVPTPGEIVEVEINDLFDKPRICSARAAWVRQWKDSTMLPGAGLNFEDTEENWALQKMLARHFAMTRLHSYVE